MYLYAVFHLPTPTNKPCFSLPHKFTHISPTSKSATLTMKFNLHISLLLTILVLCILTSSAVSQKDPQIKNKGPADGKISSADSFDKLMLGVEECGNGEEECLLRRATLEAHLDYIYTQKRTP